MRQSLGHPFARLLMRRGEKERLDAAGSEQVPGEWLDAELVGRQTGKLRMNRRQRFACGAFPAQKERGITCEPRMAQQQARQLSASVAGHTHYRDLCLSLFH